MTNRNTVDAQARWARAFHRRVTGSQIRLANTTPATAAVRLDCDTPSSFSPPATTAARTTVPATASTNRRMADHAPALRERRRPGRNNEAEPTGAATIAASSNVSSMPALTLHFRAVLLTSPGGSMRAGAEYGRARTGQAVGGSAAARQQAGLLFAQGRGQLIAAHPGPARQVTLLGQLVQLGPALGRGAPGPGRGRGPGRSGPGSGRGGPGSGRGGPGSGRGGPGSGRGGPGSGRGGPGSGRGGPGPGRGS